MRTRERKSVCLRERERERERTIVSIVLLTYSFRLQQKYVLAELREYLDSKPVDAASVEKSLQFLQALANLFEQGFLSHDRITSTNSPILHNMQFGYSFFCAWLEHLLEQGKHYSKYVTGTTVVTFNIAGLMPTNPYQSRS